MATYLSSVVLAAGIMALASLFAPEGKQKKWVNFIFGLVSFSVIVSPITNLSAELIAWPMPSMSETETAPSAEEYLWEIAAQAMAEDLAKAFSLSPQTIDIAIEEKTDQFAVFITVENGEKENTIAEIKTWAKAYLGEGWEVYINGR